MIPRGGGVGKMAQGKTHYDGSPDMTGSEEVLDQVRLVGTEILPGEY